jgi:hypothetical protein
MIRKSGSRFSETPAHGLEPGITFKQQSKARLPVSADIARFRCKRAAWQGRPRRSDNGFRRTGNKKPEPTGPGFFELSRTLIRRRA